MSTIRPFVRQFSTTPLRSAISTAGRPKRSATTYGLPSSSISPPREEWPARESTDTSGHPLWRFFHEKESLTVPDKRRDDSGRSWAVSELRRKSFEELHELWYVLLRERNVLLTQREEARRLRVDLNGFSHHGDKLKRCQKSMAAIKATLSERRHAILDAAEILRERGDVDGARRISGEADRIGEAELEVERDVVQADEEVVLSESRK
ncbi:hypothetical protein MNV49_005164 [Pseudohyphozyma bogoriensis]|nr:hypothetical protein MNV49_005164 [Pseudohyphozyma bogoriensis]